MKTFEDQLLERKNKLEKSLEDKNGLLPPKKKPVPPDQNEVEIDLLLSQKKIRVRFKYDPGYEMGKLLTDFGFQWLISPSKHIYEHDDTLEARKFLNEYLDAQLELDGFEQPLEVKVRDSEDTIPLEPISNPDFEEYVIKVKKLLKHYEIDQADLAVLAIDTLYKTTFPN